MKRLLSFAATLLLLASCTTEIDQQFGSRAAAPGNKTKFQASVEACTAPDTKVYADENMKVLWNADDRISIFNMTTCNSEYAFEGDDGDTAGSFAWVSEGEEGEAIDCVYAVYPYQPGTTVSTSGDVTLTLPAEQAYKVNSFGVGANTMVAVTEETFLAFKNVGGYLSLRLYGDNISVRRITIRGNGGEKIAGKGMVEMPLGGTPTVTMDGTGTDAVSIVCDPVVKIGRSAESFTDFWFVIPPVTFKQGFTITVVDDMGGVFTKSTSKSFTVSRNTLDWMKELKVVPDYDNVNIEFEDDNFKAYCVENFDTDHDGEVSGAEAEVVTRIDVCTDNIKSIKGIEFFASLESLTCKGSKIGTKGPGDAYAGQLESIDVSKNVHLWELDCSGNKIEEVDVSNNPQLQTLICNDNPIEEVILAPDQVIATLESPVSSNVVYEWEDADVPAVDEIWYTTSDGSTATMTRNASFGDVTLVSNTYVDGKGVLKFSGPVKTIGRGSFELSNLSSVTLPEGLTTLADWAFSHCEDMISITMPSTLTSIGANAFISCTKLTYMTIPDNVTEIGDAAFLALKSVKSFQGKYASSDHKYLIKDWQLITIAPAGITSFTIPDGVTSIGNYALACYPDIQSVTIPSSVTSIGESAFEQISFTSITLPENLRSIGPYAFKLCNALTSVTIPQSVTSIGDGAFFHCDKLQEFNGKYASDDHRCLIVNGRIVSFASAGLTEYVIPSNVTRIPNGIFTNNMKLTSITVPDNIDTIDWASFSGCTALTSFTIPASVTTIYEEAFTDCISLTSLTVLASVPPTLQAWYTPNNIFANTNNCPIYVPAGSVDTYKATEGWSQYADRILEMSGSGVVPTDFPDENFRAYIFDNFDTDKDRKLSQEECDAVTNITVCTDSIATVQGIEFFQNLRLLSCEGSSEYVAATRSYIGFGQLTSLDLSNNLSLNTLRCSYNLLTSLDVSDNVALEYVACSHNQLSSLELGQNSKLRTLYCEYNQLTSLDVSNNPALIDLQCQKNLLTSLDVSSNTALQGLQCANNQLTTLDVSNNLALVYLNAYDNPLDTLFMASGQEIETLYKDNGTTIVYIGPATNEIWYTSTDGSVVEPFATDVFGVNIVSNTYSDGKGVIVFDGPVTMVGYRAFDGCMSLSSVMLPSTIQQIGECAFYDCSALQSINLPESVSVIDSYAFASCSSLQEITIPQSVNNIYGVFANCTGLAQFYGKFADASGRALISGTTLMAVASAGLTSFSVPEGIKYISAAVFSGRGNLSEITLPEGLLTIGNEAFMGTGIKSLVIPETVNYIGYKVFSGCSNLVSINLPENITTINGELFRGCVKLNAVEIPTGVTSINSFAFSKCSSLTTLVIPANVASLGYESISYCSSLQSLVFESAVPPTGGQAMMKNTTCPIYVPAASVDAYKTADDYWSGYANQIQPAAPLPTVVDLGLSVKWATFNLGASSPEGSGNKYAWGETQPKSSYSWENYKWCKGTENTLTKYCYDSTYGNEGYSDAKRTLDLADDAVSANLGGSWRMPTVDEYLELRNTNNCDWTWNENYQGSGVSGYVVTSKKEGYTDKSIFIPAVSLWTSSISTSKPIYAYKPYFTSEVVQWSSDQRYFGHFIRPVYTE